MSEPAVAAQPTDTTSILSIGAVASAAAAILHGTAAGVHADHVGLSRIFLVLAVLQGTVAVLGFVRSDRVACSSMFVVNAGAALGWLVTRLVAVEKEAAAPPDPRLSRAFADASVSTCASPSVATTVAPSRAAVIDAKPVPAPSSTTRLI